MTKLSEQIQSLLTYANGVTGEEDTTLGDAVRTLADGFGGGGEDENLAKLIDRSITSIVIPSSVTSIGQNAFTYCNSLKEVTIPSSVTLINASAFASLASLEKVTFSEGLIKIGNSAFTACTALTEITIPSTITNILNGAFSGCTALKKLTIKGDVITFNGAFNYLTALEKIVFHSTFSAVNTTFQSAKSNLVVVCLRETPFAIPTTLFTGLTDLVIYVPSSSVDAYKAQSGWSTYADHIYANPEE